MKSLVVWLNRERVGTLIQEDSGRLSFCYDESWRLSNTSKPLSASLPLREKPFSEKETRPFFAGLLPEDAVRDTLARYFGISSRNDFALLAEIGHECAGAVAFYPEGEVPAPVSPVPAAELTESELAERLRDLPKRPLFVGTELRLSLAGAQNKVAVCLVDGEPALPRGGAPTTHVIKTPIDAFPETVPNELFCLRLAVRLGMPTPRAELRGAEDVDYLLIERYDRIADDSGTHSRIHQEDFCQALAIPPELKYQSEGGPSLPGCFELLSQHTRQPAADRLAFLDTVVFNYIVGNGDAHGKNFSLLYDPSGTRLAPLYDVLCTQVYPTLTRRMAMKIGGKYLFDDVLARHWETFARDAGLTPNIVRRRLRELAPRVVLEAENEAATLRSAGIDAPIFEAIIASIRRRVVRVSQQ